MAERRPYFFISLCWVLLCLLCGISSGRAQRVEENDYFYVLNTRHGLSDNRILQMMQLPDNRLAVRTRLGVNLYDGKRFVFVALPDEKAQVLAGYRGQTHLYADNHERLWVKDYQKLFCIDLVKGKLKEHPLDSVGEELAGRSLGSAGEKLAGHSLGSAGDMFVDSKRNVWIVRGERVTPITGQGEIQLRKSWGTLQDLDTDGRYVYAFFDSGMVAAFLNGKLAYTVSAFQAFEVRCYRSTSLTVQTPSGQFYQIRTGYDEIGKHDASIFLHFDPETRKYSKIFACDYILHTLNMSSDNQALISSQRGYLMFDFKVGNAPREVRELALPDGKSLTTGINTVYRDREGGIWLGTYHDGLIYVSPMLGLFFTMDKPWWQSGWGVALGIALIVVVALALVFFRGLHSRRRRRNDVKMNSLFSSSSSDVVGQTMASVKQDETRSESAVCNDSSEDNDSPEDNVSAEPELVRSVRSLIEQHLIESEYGVEQLAHDLCMERTGLYKKLTLLTATTPVAFIRGVRLQRAAELLKEGRFTVNEIAEQTGFSSPSYFTKCFKKEYGVLPSEYK